MKDQEYTNLRSKSSLIHTDTFLGRKINLYYCPNVGYEFEGQSIAPFVDSGEDADIFLLGPQLTISSIVYRYNMAADMIRRASDQSDEWKEFEQDIQKRQEQNEEIGLMIQEAICHLFKAGFRWERKQTGLFHLGHMVSLMDNEGFERISEMTDKEKMSH